MGTVVLVIGLLLCAVACVMWATETHLSRTPPTTPEPRAPIHPQNPPDPRAAIQYDNHRDRPTEFLPNTRLRADRPVNPRSLPRAPHGPAHDVPMDPNWRPTAVREPPREPATPPRSPSGVSGSHSNPTVYVPILGTNHHCPNCRCPDALR
ncbi:MAG: hypothetical protein ACREQ5_00220 [Candidatus Dormibacteria bacterium]